MDKPTKIQCVTGQQVSTHKEHLCSPTRKNGLLMAEEQTIVDCFTFGLRLNKRRIDPVEHYTWFIGLAEEIQHEEGIVLIAPDMDWIGEDITLALSDIWLSKINAKVMPVTHSYLFSQIELENTIGYAVNGKHNGPSHPEWTHSFSKFYKQLKGPTNRWTYDTTDK